MNLESNKSLVRISTAYGSVYWTCSTCAAMFAPNEPWMSQTLRLRKIYPSKWTPGSDLKFIQTSEKKENWMSSLDHHCLRQCIPGCALHMLLNLTTIASWVEIGTHKTREKDEILLFEKGGNRSLHLGKHMFKCN